MATAAEYLELLYPYFFVTTDPRYSTPENTTAMLALAEEYRPKCLTENKQNLAVAHYAAYLISSTSQTAASSGVNPPQAQPVKRWREGEVEQEFFDGRVGSEGISPLSPYDAWYRLYKLCRGGIVVSDAFCQRGGGGPPP